MEPFDRFWAAYPRRIGKGAARRVFARLSKSGVLPELQEVLDAVEAQVLAYKARASFHRDGWTYFPHPTTWLNQERWDDDVPIVVPRSHSTPRAEKYEDIG